MKSLNVGIIGCGNMGRRHARAYQYHAPRTHLVAAYDLYPETARKFADQFECQIEPSLELLLQRQDIDAVSICTIETAHVEPTLVAAKNGKHILLEKPMAMNMEEALKMKQAVDRAGIKLMVGHLYRFDHRCIEAKRLIDSGQIGRLVSIDGRFHGTPAQQDRIRDVEMPLIAFRGCHVIDLMRWFTGSELSRVYSESIDGTLRAMGYHSEDAAYCLLRFANGVLGSIEVTAQAPASHPTAGLAELVLTGTKGMIQLDLAQPWLTLANDKGYMLSQGTQKDLWFREEIGAFADYVLDDGPNVASAVDAIAALEFASAAVESAKSHQPIFM
ncbi:MAG TPA: Gfo/Idh/MocA family oxidoreductase, partial [Tepidisphaeraceae bacterium]|nr:Gfo/Idh/MocA family oxidoreductase [Tepidisphaeraceae bacterium]